MLFAIFGLDLWQSFFLGFMIVCYGLWEIGKKAASNSTVQKGFW